MTVASVPPRTYKIKVRRPLIETEACLVVPLTRNQFALADYQDREILEQWNWHARWDSSYGTYHAIRNSRGAVSRQTILMAREIMNPKATERVDHHNHDTLDNRRENLRIATFAQNVYNSRKRRGSYSSEFKGVRWHESSHKWEARIRAGGPEVYLGVFTCPIEAAKAYDEAAIELHGEFACLNFPEEGP